MALSASIGICLIWAFAGRLSPRNAQAATLATPFTGSSTRVTLKQDGSLAHTETRALVVRADGSSVELFYRDPINPAHPTPMRIIRNLQVQQSIHLVPFVKTKTTYPMTPAELAGFQPPNPCSGQISGTMLGYDVLRSSESMPQRKESGLDRIESVRWRAPKLDCVPLRTEERVFKDGQVAQTTVESYITVVEGVADKDWFDVPADYQEQTPGQVMTLAAQMYPDNVYLKLDPRCPLAPLDDVYARSERLKKNH